MLGSERYRAWCADEGEKLRIFRMDWWLDLVAGADAWNAAVVERGDGVVATLPFVIKRRFGLTTSGQPPLTKYLGPWLQVSSARQARSSAAEKKLMFELLDQMPRLDGFSQNWEPELENWLPFYWRGFRQTTRYTYVLKEFPSMEVLWQGLDTNIRTDIRKAQQRFGVTVECSPVIDDVIPLYEASFRRQAIAPPIGRDLLRAIGRACQERNCGMSLIARGPDGKAQSCVYIVWDKHSAYYLIGGGDPTLRNSGAGSLCLWKAIEFAAALVPTFDFEGSMVEGIERYFRAFGGKQEQYFRVWRESSLVQATKAVRRLRR